MASKSSEKKTPRHERWTGEFSATCHFSEDCGIKLTFSKIKEDRNEFLLLSVCEGLKRGPNKPTWDDIAKTMSPTTRGAAVQQHIAKIKKNRLDNGLIVPPGPYSERVEPPAKDNETKSSGKVGDNDSGMVMQPRRNPNRRPKRRRVQRSESSDGTELPSDDSQAEFAPRSLKSQTNRHPKKARKTTSVKAFTMEEEQSESTTSITQLSTDETSDDQAESDTSEVPQKIVRLKVDPALMTKDSNDQDHATNDTTSASTSVYQSSLSEGVETIPPNPYTAVNPGNLGWINETPNSSGHNNSSGLTDIQHHDYQMDQSNGYFESNAHQSSIVANSVDPMQLDGTDLPSSFMQPSDTFDDLMQMRDWYETDVDTLDSSMDHFINWD